MVFGEDEALESAFVEFDIQDVSDIEGQPLFILERVAFQ